VTSPHLFFYCAWRALCTPLGGESDPRPCWPFLVGCTTTPQQQQVWVNKASDVTAKAVDQTSKAFKIASDQAAKALVRMQHYLAEKDTLKTFYDAGEHSESVVLEVLHRSGVNAKGGTAGAHSGTTTGKGTGTTPPPRR